MKHKMIDPIKNAYLKIKTLAPKVQKKVNTDPILFDGKTFDDERSAREDDPKESIEDVVRQLKETFDVPPKVNIQDYLDATERDILSQRGYNPESQKYHVNSDHEHIKNMHKTFVDLVKNGVNQSKMSALDKIIDDAPIHMDDKYAIGRMWSKTIGNVFGIKEDEMDKINTDKPTHSKTELLNRVSSVPDVRLHTPQHGYTKFEHISVPIVIHNDGTPHVVHPSSQYGGAFDKFIPFQEMDENAHKEVHEQYKKHFYPILDQEPSKLRSLMRYTGSASGKLNRFLIHSHNGNEEALKDEMSNHEHEYPDKEAYHKEIQGVSDALKEAPPIEKPLTVYSGLSGRSNIMHHAMKHIQTSTEPMKFHLPAFTSTSTRFNTGAAFAKDAPIMPDEESLYHPKMARKDIQDVLKIHLPAGHKEGAYVDPISENSGEYEYLLDKGHTLKVHPEPSYTIKGGSVYRIWEAHPHKEEE